MRKLHKPIRTLIFDCEVPHPERFGFRDDIVTTWSQPSLEKIVSLSLADRAVEFFQHRHHVFPNFAFLTGRLVPQ